MGALRQRIDECLPAQPQLRDAMQLVMAGNSSPSIQYTPLRNGTVLTSLHSVNFASAPLLDETLFATGAPSQNYRPWKRRGPCLKTVRRVWLERAAVSS